MTVLFVTGVVTSAYIFIYSLILFFNIEFFFFFCTT